MGEREGAGLKKKKKRKERNRLFCRLQTSLRPQISASRQHLQVRGAPRPTDVMGSSRPQTSSQRCSLCPQRVAQLPGGGEIRPLPLAAPRD